MVSRPQEGLFGLRVWIEEGFFPDGWGGSSGGVAPFKKRNVATKVSFSHTSYVCTLQPFRHTDTYTLCTHAHINLCAAHLCHSQTRKPAGRAAKGRAQASWQASEERDEDSDEHEYEDADGGDASEEGGEDSAFKVRVGTIVLVSFQECVCVFVSIQMSICYQLLHTYEIHTYHMHPHPCSHQRGSKEACTHLLPSN